MNSFPGAGAEILTDRMRDILSPKKASTAEWLRAMRTAEQNGLKGSTNIVWGSEETDEEIISHLSHLRDLQDQTGGVLSFIPWTFQAQTKGFKLRKVPPHRISEDGFAVTPVLRQHNAYRGFYHGRR